MASAHEPFWTTAIDRDLNYRLREPTEGCHRRLSHTSCLPESGDRRLRRGCQQCGGRWRTVHRRRAASRHTEFTVPGRGDPWCVVRVLAREAAQVLGETYELQPA
jgi:hypothetical protein